MSYQINELAKLVDVSIRTLRYYDKIGLLVPDRGANDHRYYSQKNYFELLIIRELKELGLSLAEITDLFKNHSTDFNELLLLRKEVLNQSIKQQRQQLAHVEQLLELELTSLADFESITFESAIFKQNPYQKAARKIWQQDLSNQEILKYALASEVTNNDFETYYIKLAKLQTLPVSASQVQLEIKSYLTFLKQLYQGSIDEAGLLAIAKSYQTSQQAISYFHQYGEAFSKFLAESMSYYLTNTKYDSH